MNKLANLVFFSALNNKKLKEILKMNMEKIIGMPAIVSARYRIVIDKSFRKLFNIKANDAVIMQRGKSFLRIKRADRSSRIEVKEISMGRFNLPTEWAAENKVNIGDYVYLLATTNGMLICPRNIDFLFFNEVIL